MWGKKLEACRKARDLSAAVVMAEGIKDEFDEAQYSAVHFDFKCVIDLINCTISQKRTSQEYILLEGLCNNTKMEHEEDRLQNRNMDELFTISMCIGEIAGFASLVYKEENANPGCEEFEKFEEPVEEEVKEDVKPVGDDDAGEGEPVVDDKDKEEEEKKDTWDPKAFKWTVTNRKSKNMAQLYRDYSGSMFESCCKKAEDCGGEGASDQITNALADFCKKVVETPTVKHFN